MKLSLGQKINQDTLIGQTTDNTIENTRLESILEHKLDLNDLRHPLLDLGPIRQRISFFVVS